MSDSTSIQAPSRSRRRRSLSMRTFRMTLIQTLLLSLVALLIGLSIYTYSLVSQYAREAFNIARTASALLDKSLVQPLADDVMDAYNAQSDAERDEVWTDEYRARFSDFKAREDYRRVDATLREFADGFDLSAIYLAAFDEARSAMVYLLDSGDPELVLTPGEWDSVSPEGIRSFMNWNGTDPVHQIANTEEYGWLCTSGVPVTDGDGGVRAFLFVDVYLWDILQGMRLFVGGFILAMSIATAVFAFLVPRSIQKTVAQPIDTIARAAQSYVSDRQSGADVHDHFSSLNIHSSAELEDLANVMANMEQDMSEYMDHLTHVTAEKERISTELALATQIQESMLPHIFPAFPERSEFDIYATMDPAKEVGGDFYDYFLIDDDHLCMLIADVSGKGVPAALFMMASKIILKNNALPGRNAAEILARTNETICAQNDQEMFVTVWLGILEISTGRLNCANAGHEFPTQMKAGGAFELIQDKHGFVIGGMSGMRYRDYDLQLNPGDKIFVYTDGLAEATNGQKELFGTERILPALNACKDESLQGILGYMKAEVDLFVGDAPQFDDLTMLCFVYNGPMTEDNKEAKKEH